MNLFMQKLGVLTLALSAFLPASAYDFKVDGIYYNITDPTAKEVEVTYEKSPYSSEPSYSGHVSVPSSVSYNGTLYAVKKIGRSAFSRCSGLTSVYINKSVTTILEDAFSACSGLTVITIPSTVTLIMDNFKGCSSLTEITIDIDNQKFSSIDGILYNKSLTSLIRCPEGKTGDVIIRNAVTIIDDDAFYCCDGLTSITIPSSVTSIRSRAFYGCDGLTSITIPGSVTSIGDGAFCGCSSLSSPITIPNSVTTIEDDTFYGCSNLTSIDLPNSLTKIGYAAFQNCSSMTSIVIPNSVKLIDDNAFQNCSSLTSIIIPNSVTQIGDKVFFGCSSMTSIDVHADNLRYASNDGILFNKSYENLIYCPGGRIGEVTITNNVITIWSYAFKNCEHLTSVVLPNSVVTIGAEAFSGCRNLISMDIPNSVQNIFLGAFSSCSSLTSITIPKNVKTFGGSVFNFCTSLTSITSLAVTPPTCNSTDFFNIDKTNCTLYVPAGSKAAYQKATEWMTFPNIEEIALVSEIRLSESEVSIKEGATFQLTAEVLPEDAAIKGLQWESSDDSCVTVDESGLLTAIKQGTATITVRSADGNAQATCLVKVVPTTGIETVESAADGTVEVFTLTGVKVAESTEGLPTGIYLVRRGSTVSKVVVK